ncbi:MAG: efflux RND transporter periplasmic adaptor subunit, partial [Bacteroidetes bacterium]|nr:efflux RND transporter periplasmic adaptor subunit [Bacteroidota bacterium]
KGDFEFDNRNFSLKLTKIYPEVKNGRFSVDMEFIGKTPEQIRIGQTARIRLELGESKQALLIPRGGFYQSTGGQWVYVVSKDGKVASKEIFILVVKIRDSMKYSMGWNLVRK